jgi:signal transduction histidine kinase/ActR/RegA family two-component response regulator
MNRIYFDEIKKLSEELAMKSKQLDDVLTNSQGMVYQFQLEPDGTMFIPYISPQSLEIYEITSDDLLADPKLMLEMVHLDERTNIHQQIMKSATELKRFQWIGRILTANKKIKWIKTTNVPRKLDSGSILWDGIAVDITKEKMLEQHLFDQRRIAEHAARLASLGELAAGVGHEINNPLAVVMGNIEKLKREMESSGALTPSIAAIMKKQMDGCERIRKIVLGLRSLAHAGRQEDKADAADLGECVKSTVDLVAEIYSNERIEIVFNQPSSRYVVSSSTTHVQQVLMNLMSNAKDALHDSATPKIKIDIDDHGNYCTLSVIDNGSGIKTEDQAKMFSSFFTTKGVGRGTGLGLAISKSIVEADGGKIYFESSEAGTKFCVDFPKQSFKSPQDEVPVPIPDQAQLLKVLIVDDEEDVREVLGFLLGQQQCDVVAAESGEQALCLLETKTFDLIVTDAKMPGMNGGVLLEEISKRNLAPQATKVIMTGGVVDDLTSANGTLMVHLIDGSIAKPFEYNELLAMITRVQKRKAAA